jgi:hypothetical protein
VELVQAGLRAAAKTRDIVRLWRATRNSALVREALSSRALKALCLAPTPTCRGYFTLSYGTGRTMTALSRLTAAAEAPWLSTLPSIVAPVRSEVAVPAIIVPFMIEFVPRVTLLPAVQ